MVISFLAVAQSAPFPNWENTEPDYFLQPQELCKGVTLVNYLHIQNYKGWMKLDHQVQVYCVINRSADSVIFLNHFFSRSPFVICVYSNLLEKNCLTPPLTTNVNYTF